MVERLDAAAPDDPTGLRDERCRAVVRYLERTGERCPASEVTRYLVRRAGTGDVTVEQYRETHLRVHRELLPLLAASGVVSYDETSGEVSLQCAD